MGIQNRKQPGDFSGQARLKTAGFRAIDNETRSVETTLAGTRLASLRIAV